MKKSKKVFVIILFLFYLPFSWVWHFVIKKIYSKLINSREYIFFYKKTIVVLKKV